MILNLYILAPLIAGILLMVFPNVKQLSKILFPFVSALLLSFTINNFTLFSSSHLFEYKECWFSLNHIQAYFALQFGDLSGLMLLLTSFVFTILSFYLFFSKEKQEFSNSFYGLLLLVFAGLNGVFLANDLILFYFFWELVLIPVYFLIGLWSKAKNSIKANISFFLYTIFGSMFMLGGIIFIGFYLKPDSFLLQDIISVTSSKSNLGFLFTLFLIAFIIKIPLFPFHTWQPTIYKTSPTPITVVLSALMAKMGLFAVVHWLLNIFPSNYNSFEIYQYIIAFGLIYASLIAMVSNNIKKIIAYSSIAHLALIFLALFSTKIAVQGAYFQMFSHGLVVLGLWICVDIAERKYQANSINSLSGLASVDAPLSILMMIFGLANVALPLTSSFIGEFTMLSGLYQTKPIICIMACAGVILSAVYTLRFLGKILFGETNIVGGKDSITKSNYWYLWIVAIIIVILGIYPSVILNSL